MPGRKARILLADDHAMVREGLCRLLDAESDLEVSAECCDGREAVDRALADDVDLVILDVAMPRLTGLQAAREIVRAKPGLPILILSMHRNEQFFFESMRVGVAGYVLKSSAGNDLVDACRAALDGERSIYPQGVKDSIGDRLERGPADEVTDVLSPRELQVVKLIAEGLTNAQIARDLVISEKTVERHRENILRKLGMHDRVELTRYAIRRGLLEA
jgi:DNA-binding NarL/FixJ family response regulator